MYPSSADIKDSEGNALVTSYAVHRPDGNWSLMLVNRDENNPHSVRVLFDDSGKRASFSGLVTFVTFGSEQYVWINDGLNSHADPDYPPASTSVAANAGTTFTLPRASITVLRGRVPGVREEPCELCRDGCPHLSGGAQLRCWMGKYLSSFARPGR